MLAWKNRPIPISIPMFILPISRTGMVGEREREEYICWWKRSVYNAVACGCLDVAVSSDSVEKRMWQPLSRNSFHTLTERQLAVCLIYWWHLTLAATPGMAAVDTVRSLRVCCTDCLITWGSNVNLTRNRIEGPPHSGLLAHLYVPQPHDSVMDAYI